MKKIVSIILMLAMVFSCISAVTLVSAKESSFTDVIGTKDEWANEYIEKMVEKKILDGVGGGKFEPEGLLTREQFAKVLVAAIPQEDKGITAEFDDVTEGQWYVDYIEKAVASGIMKGKGDGKFGVGENIKRCDMALGIARLDKTDEELKAYEDKIPDSVGDKETIPEYAKGAMGYCYEKGIFSGDEKGNFNPFDNTTRAQIAKVICVYVEGLEEEPTNEPTKEPTKELTGEEPTKEEEERPLITGDFIQPGFCATWSQDRWNKHLDQLVQAGIDTFIIQWIANSPNGVIGTVYYPADLPDYTKGSSYNKYAMEAGMLEKCLKAAEERGIKVYVGLNAADEWWSKAVSDKTWYTQQSEIGNAIAKEVYDLYKEKYPNALAGFYWWFEMYNGMGGREEAFADMININLDYLTTLDPSIPFVLSPFVSRNTTSVKAQQEWTKFFSYARFRKGDIFTMQDAVGAGHIDITQLDEYYAAIKNAVDTEPNVEFWANNENFIQSTWGPSPLSRVVEQMEITDKYVTKHISFSYSHYYALEGAKDDNYRHEVYLEYKNKGKILD